MFASEDDKKLDWMYKGPNSTVNREEYLLGRSVDKTLEQLNEEDKNKATNNFLAPAKNHVEHECIPPSIRDYNKIVKSEQVDLQAKLQEDPLVLIKRQEEETRRQFLQNPIQLKKLQEALQAQMKKKKRKEDTKIDKKLKKKLKLLNKQLQKKGGYKKLKIVKEDDEEAILDTILMHKFNFLKTKLSEDDLKDIVLGNFSESEDSDKDNDSRDKYFKSLNLDKNNRNQRNSSVDSDDENQRKENKSSKTSQKRSPERNYKPKKDYHNIKERQKNDIEVKKKSERKKLTEEEKEALRKSMMQQAADRSKESAKSYKKYKEEYNKPEVLTHHGDEFIRNQLMKSAGSSTVADRIKSNLNNIQRSKSSMNSNFLK